MIVRPLAEASSGGVLLIPILAGIVGLFVAGGLIAGFIAARVVGRGHRDPILLPAVASSVAAGWVAKAIAPLPDNPLPVLLGVALVTAFVTAGVQRILRSRANRGRGSRL